MPNLYKIILNGKVSHLYATCHIQHEEVCTLSEETKQAFEQANCVVVEITIEEQNKANQHFSQESDAWKMQAQIDSQKQLADYLSITQLKHIADLFGDELVQAHPSHLALFNLIDTAPMFLYQKIITKQLMNLGLLGNDSLDKQIEKQAKLHGKPTASLDTLEDLAQRYVGLAFTYQEQVDYAKYMLDNLLSKTQEEIKKQYLEIVNTYLTRDPEELKKMDNNLDHSTVCNAYKKCLVYERDPIFIKTMLPHLEAGNAFIAMGALHIPGVLSLLQECGCIIEPVEEGKRLYKVNTLENTNKSLRKANLLSDVQFALKCGQSTGWTSILFAADSNILRLHHKLDLPIFLELIREGEINRGCKIEIEINSEYNDEELLVLRDILQERNTPKSITVHLTQNTSDENIAFIAEIFKSECSIKDLTINFSYSNHISENSLKCLIDALKTQAFTGKLNLKMGNDEFNSPLYPELISLINTQKKGYSNFF